MDYSVLMSVYHKEKADYLRRSMLSMYHQTAPTNDFVLVCDGPLNETLDQVIEEMQICFGDVLQVVRLRENIGLGRALNEGMNHCKNDRIARMDSDDISYPDRCEKELAIFSRYDVSIVSAAVEEFIGSTDHVRARRVPPESPEEILRYAKKRNPFNHPCVMFKKTDVETVGGYQDFYLLEDYYLWVRMLMKGFNGYNIQQPLLWMRAGSDLYKRRAGWKYVKSQKALFKFMKESGFIGGGRYMGNVLVRSAAALLPTGVRTLMYKTMMRK